MAMRSPRWNRLVERIVWWISVSKTWMKHGLQSFEWSFGRRISARFVLHTAQSEGGMLAVLRGVRVGRGVEGRSLVMSAGRSREICVRVIFRGAGAEVESVLVIVPGLTGGLANYIPATFDAFAMLPFLEGVAAAAASSFQSLRVRSLDDSVVQMVDSAAQDIIFCWANGCNTVEHSDDRHFSSIHIYRASLGLS